MPKNPPRNAFYFYMMDFREDQRKKGFNYGSLQEVAIAAGPIYKEASEEIRAKYTKKAKDEKEKRSGQAVRYTTHGVPLAEIEQMEQDRKNAEAVERQEIINFVKLKGLNNSLLDENIYLMDVNYYCKVRGEYLIGEMTLLKFSLREGIKENYHEVINPGYIPKGYAYEIKLGCQEFGLEMPDEFENKTDCILVLANIMDFLKQRDRNVKTLPQLYTMPDKVEPVVEFIQQMCSKAAENDQLFRVYKLNTLFYYMINEVKTDQFGGFPKESLALTQLKTDRFKYTAEYTCELHEEKEKTVECTLSRVSRWAYSVLDVCCSHAGLPLQPGRHLPGQFDLQAISASKEERRALHNAASSLNTTLSDSFNDSLTLSNASIASDKKKKEKRTNAPMRMPNAYYSQERPPALSEMSAPLAVGRGRGARPKN